jgi:hypothetical protein
MHVGVELLLEPLVQGGLADEPVVRIDEVHEPGPDVGHAPAVVGVLEQVVDQLGSFVRGAVVDERGRFLWSRDDADDVQRHAADELAVGRFGGRLDRAGAETGVDLLIDEPGE